MVTLQEYFDLELLCFKQTELTIGCLKAEIKEKYLGSFSCCLC